MKKGICTVTKLLVGCWMTVPALAIAGQPIAPMNHPFSSNRVLEAQATHHIYSLSNVPIDGPDIICPGEIIAFCTPEVAGAKYHWGISGNATITDSADKFCTQVAAPIICDGVFTLRVRVEGPDFDSVFEKTVLVQDKVAPTIACPKDITVSCDEQLPSPDPSAMTVSDNCNGTVQRAFVSGLVFDVKCLNQYKITRTYKATDICGNVSTCTQHVEVKDELSPNMTCPPNVTVTCPDQALTPDVFYVIATDNCGFVALKKHVSDKVSSLPQANQYAITRTYEAEDKCGNSQTCSQKITVTDTEVPTISCPASMTVSCPLQIPAASPGNAQISDNCGAPFLNTSVVDVVSDHICGSQYTLTRTFRVTDAAGHTASCVQQFWVNDQTPPTITCPPNSTVSCGDQALVIDLGAVIANDNCNAMQKSHVQDVITNKICENNFTLTRTFKVQDDCGRSATCSVKIRVQNQTAAPVVCPANVTVSCASEVPAYNAASAAVSDYCGNVINTVTWLGDLVTNKTCNSRYQILRSYRATDACGVTGNCVQKITVNDQTKPVLACPANVTVSCATQIPGTAPGAVSVTDNCSGGNLSIYVGDAITNGTCPSRYLITRTYRSKDVCGNEGTCVQLINVDDQTPPVVKCPSNITVTCASLVPPANLALVTGTDNCTGTLTKQFAGDVISDQTCTNRFLLTRKYQASDLCGNIGDCTQQITVSDQKAPASITCPANITVTSTSQTPAVNVAAIVASGENCGGAILKNHVEDLISDRSCEGSYLLTRVYSAADACGNSKTCQQKIAVKACYCTFTPEFWSKTDNKIANFTTTQVLDSLFRQGGITLGNVTGDCSWLVGTAACIPKILPGAGPSLPLEKAELPDCNDQLENALAGQVIALQLNIRFNTLFRGMNLGSLPMANVCGMSAAQLATLGLPPDATIQDLLLQANAYLAGNCSNTAYPNGYGEYLAAGIATINGYWDSCQQNKPCNAGNLDDDNVTERNSDDTPPLAAGDLSLHPNPVAAQLQVRFTAVVPAETQFRVFDLDGKLILSRTAMAVAGNNTLEIDVAGWNPGVYWLVWAGSDAVTTKRFVVMRK